MKLRTHLLHILFICVAYIPLHANVEPEKQAADAKNKKDSSSAMVIACLAAASCFLTSAIIYDLFNKKPTSTNNPNDHDKDTALVSFDDYLKLFQQMALAPNGTIDEAKLEQWVSHVQNNTIAIPPAQDPRFVKFEKFHNIRIGIKRGLLKKDIFNTMQPNDLDNLHDILCHNERALCVQIEDEKFDQETAETLGIIVNSKETKKIIVPTASGNKLFLPFFKVKETSACTPFVLNKQLLLEHVDIDAVQIEAAEMMVKIFPDRWEIRCVDQDESRYGIFS